MNMKFECEHEDMGFFFSPWAFFISSIPATFFHSSRDVTKNDHDYLGGLQKAKRVMELAKCIAEIGLLSFCVPSNLLTLSCTATMLLGRIT